MSKENIIVGVIAIAIVIFASLFIFGIMPTPSNNTAITQKEEKMDSTTPAPLGELKIEDITVGQGQEAKSGDTVVVHYTGTLENGKKFDSSLDRGQPFETQIGVGSVIKGWDQGIPGMKVGGKRKLTIPPDLGYGAQGAGADIPPNSTLIFEVELLEVK